MEVFDEYMRENRDDDQQENNVDEGSETKEKSSIA